MEASIYTDNSNIHGVGIFTKVDIRQGQVIFEVADLMRRTMGGEWITNAGKMINHQTNCNTIVQKRNHKFVLIASRDILSGEELTTNYKMLPPDVFETRVDNYIEMG